MSLHQRITKLRKKQLKRYCFHALQAVGVEQHDAEIVSEVLVTNDIRGVTSHGTFCLLNYLRHIRGGGVDPKATFTVVREGPAFVLADGQAGLGVVNSYKAMKMAIEKARHSGIATVIVRNSAHFAAAGYYAVMAAEKGMAGIAMSNADPVMAVAGSRGRVIGNNPIACAVPGLKGIPIFLDIAWSKVAGLKVMSEEIKGKPIPTGWVIDREGNAINDPADFRRGGALLPIGDYKGSGFAIMIECLTAVLSGAAMLDEIHNWTIEHDKASNEGHLFLAIDIDQFIPIEDFHKRVGILAAKIRKAPKMSGVDRIFLPGEIEIATEQRSLKDGFSPDEATLSSLKAIAEEFALQHVFNDLILSQNEDDI